MTLIEIAVALPIILVAGVLLLSTVTASAQQRTINRENALAAEALRAAIERMRNEDFDQLIALFDADPLNDPDGPGTAPGSSFTLPGLKPTADDPDGIVGEIRLPLLDVAGAGAARPEWQVREDMVDAELGLPRDLSGDGLVDALDHRADARIFPIVVRARWQGPFGPRTLRIFTLITEFHY